MRLDTSSIDVELTSELATMRHLIIGCSVSGRTPTSDLGIRLYVSKGAIKKLNKGAPVAVDTSRYTALL